MSQRKKYQLQLCLFSVLAVGLLLVGLLRHHVGMVLYSGMAVVALTLPLRKLGRPLWKDLYDDFVKQVRADEHIRPPYRRMMRIVPMIASPVYGAVWMVSLFLPTGGMDAYMVVVFPMTVIGILFLIPTCNQWKEFDGKPILFWLYQLVFYIPIVAVAGCLLWLAER